MFCLRPLVRPGPGQSPDGAGFIKARRLHQVARPGKFSAAIGRVPILRAHGAGRALIGLAALCAPVDVAANAFGPTGTILAKHDEDYIPRELAEVELADGEG